MRAVTFARYGPPEVLRIEEVARPVPKEDEVLVRVHATTATRSDCGLRGAEYFVARFVTGLFRPRRNTVGIEFAGEVEAVGAAVGEFSAGDRVFGLGSGTNAEYVCVREKGVIARIPDGVTYEEAAAVPDGALSAMSLLKPHVPKAIASLSTAPRARSALAACGRETAGRVRQRRLQHEEHRAGALAWGR
jgi:NADPH:quinone reductase-like Zn-dependent oxidoreductase